MNLPREFHSRFRGLERAYGTYSVQRKDESKGKMVGAARTLQKEVTDELWDLHLKGKKSIGITPIDDESNCHFGAIDIDVYKGLDLSKLEKRITELRLPLIPCLTKSGGVHLYLFIKESIPAKLVREKLNTWAVILGYPNVEVFPKQIQLANATDNGSWINMPYFGDTRKAFKGEKKLSPEQFLKYAATQVVDEKSLRKIKVKDDSIFTHAPPCIQHLCTHGFPEGTRNNGLFSVGVYVKRAFPEEWEAKLEEYNHEYFKPPLVAGEVARIIGSINKGKDYQYKCTDVPLVTVCNKAICLTREHGIGGSNEDPGVELGCLLKIESDPPIWYVDVDGRRIQFDTSGDIIDQSRFRKICFEKLDVLPKLVKQYAWDNIITDLLERLEKVPAPDDASTIGQFKLLLLEFLETQSRARHKDEIIQGHPWFEEETGALHFMSNKLLGFLNDRKLKYRSTSEVWNWLREMKGKARKHSIKGQKINVWSIPEKELSFQTEEHDTPEVGGNF